MLNINIDFEKETGLDAIDPLGDLTISDGISTIAIKATFLDSWLAALISGYNQSRDASRVTVEISEEPQSLLIEVTPAGLLSISCENQKLLPQPPQDLKDALRDAAKTLLKALGSLPDSQRNTFLDPIREFISNGSNGAGSVG
jgi:hypothetical protein